MARFRHPLQHVQVAAPCSADWDQMIGSEQVRFCAACNLNVYNLSGMTRSAAESLIAGTEERLCIRFYRRADGSIITRDCPVGLRAIQRRVSYITKAIAAALLTFLASVGLQKFFPSVSLLPPQRTMGMMARNIEPRGQVVQPQPAETMGQAIVPDKIRKRSINR